MNDNPNDTNWANENDRPQEDAGGDPTRDEALAAVLKAGLGRANPRSLAVFQKSLEQLRKQAKHSAAVPAEISVTEFEEADAGHPGTSESLIGSSGARILSVNEGRASWMSRTIYRGAGLAGIAASIALLVMNWPDLHNHLDRLSKDKAPGQASSTSEDVRRNLAQSAGGDRGGAGKLSGGIAAADADVGASKEIPLVRKPSVPSAVASAPDIQPPPRENFSRLDDAMPPEPNRELAKQAGTLRDGERSRASSQLEMDSAEFRKKAEPASPPAVASASSLGGAVANEVQLTARSRRLAAAENAPGKPSDEPAPLQQGRPLSNEALRILASRAIAPAELKDDATVPRPAAHDPTRGTISNGDVYRVPSSSPARLAGRGAPSGLLTAADSPSSNAIVTSVTLARNPVTTGTVPSTGTIVRILP